MAHALGTFRFPAQTVRALASFGLGRVLEQPRVDVRARAAALRALRKEAAAVEPLYGREAHAQLCARMRDEGHRFHARARELEPIF